MNLLTGNVSAGIGTGAALVILACGLFLLVRGRVRLSVLIPFMIAVIGIPWLFPAPERTACLQLAVGVHPPAHLS